MLITEISRKQAFITHLSFSLSVFSMLAYLVIFEWYPSYYLDLDGGNRGLATIFIVDVVLGPGLTLLVFKQGKKGLKFDMIVILLVQAIALSWGVKSVYVSRPALTVFYDGQFSCVTHDDFTRDTITRLTAATDNNPVLALLKKPDTLLAYSDFINGAYLAKSSELYYYENLFEPINKNNISRFDLYELEVEEGIQRSGQLQQSSLKSWHQYVSNHPEVTTEKKSNIKYYPLKCRYELGMAIFDTNVMQIIDYVKLYTANAINHTKLEFSEEEIAIIKARNNL